MVKSAEEWTAYYDGCFERMRLRQDAEIHEAFLQCSQKADPKFDEIVRRFPDYVMPRNTALLQELTATAMHLAGIKRHTMLLEFTVPSVLCKEPPLLITAVPAGSHSHALGEEDLNQQHRWRIGVDNGHDGTWRDERGIIVANNRFVRPQHDPSFDSPAVDALLHNRHWRPERMSLHLAA
jgi:hypothetical protein